MGISWIMYQINPALVVQFDPIIFFDLALPLILFGAGFNMRRK